MAENGSLQGHTDGQASSTEPPQDSVVFDEQDRFEKEQLAEYAEKIVRIQQACKDGDVDAICALACEKGGLVNDDCRRIAWPLILGSEKSNVGTSDEKKEPWQSLPPHWEEEQVAKDVNRSFIHYPPHTTHKALDPLKKQLSDLILEVLRRHPALEYFQGYHDIAQVFLLVLGPEAAPIALQRLSLLRIRDFMVDRGLTGTQMHLQLIPPILYAADPVVYNMIPKHPGLGLQATLTLYSHNIQAYTDIARLFDFLLAKEAVASIYLFSVLLLQKKDELLAMDPEDLEDANVMSATLQRLPQTLDLEALIESTLALLQRHPPESLPFNAWRQVSRNSVLNTTRDAPTSARQSIHDGEIWFDKLAREIRFKNTVNKLMVQARRQIWAYRRPALFGITVAIGVLGFWLGRTRPRH